MVSLVITCIPVCSSMYAMMFSMDEKNTVGLLMILLSLEVRDMLINEIGISIRKTDRKITIKAATDRLILRLIRYCIRG